MKRIPLLLALLVLVASLSAQMADMRTTLQFAVDDHRLDARALEEIDRFLAATDRSEEFEITLMGHTDSDGGLGYNEVLARHRAGSVRDRLVSLGVDAPRITMRGYGERQPLVSNDNAEEKQQNRRVEIVFSRQVLTGVNDLQRHIGSERVTRVRIDPKRDQWITGTQGTAVRVPANGLVDAHGKPIKGIAEVIITEAIALNDMIAEGLSTRSGDRILVTGGMLRVEAVDANGTPLQVGADAQMLVSIPAAIQQPGMSLFTSSTGNDWNSTGREPMDLRSWKVPNRPQYDWPKFNYPTYTADLTAKPPLPVEPARPREPLPPRRESYTSKVAWYQLLRKGHIQADKERRYDEAVGIHGEKMTKYEEKLEHYHADCRTWPTRYATYKTSFAEWQSDTACAREDFYKETLPAAEERFQVVLAASRTQYDKEVTAWRVAYDERMKDYGHYLDRLGLTNGRQLGKYVFAANQMGWINCDRFYDVPAAQKYDLVVHDPDTAQKHVYLVFTGINSMLAMERDGAGNYRQQAIPRNEPAVLVAYKVMDGKAWLCKETVQRGRTPRMEFKPASVAEVRSTIQGLRGG